MAASYSINDVVYSENETESTLNKANKCIKPPDTSFNLYVEFRNQIIELTSQKLFQLSSELIREKDKTDVALLLSR